MRSTSAWQNATSGTERRDATYCAIQPRGPGSPASIRSGARAVISRTHLDASNGQRYGERVHARVRMRISPRGPTPSRSAGTTSVWRIVVWRASHARFSRR